MFANATILRTTERHVVDSRPLRSRPRAMRVTLPYVRAIEDHPFSSAMPGDPDALPGRDRLGLAY